MDWRCVVAKRYRKIDIYLLRPGSKQYQCSTTWSRTCHEAIERYCEKTGNAASDVRAYFSKVRT